jgi:hypothetical protein
MTRPALAPANVSTHYARTFSSKFACPVSASPSGIEPRLFSFNNPFACPASVHQLERRSPISSPQSSQPAQRRDRALGEIDSPDTQTLDALASITSFGSTSRRRFPLARNVIPTARGRGLLFL